MKEVTGESMFGSNAQAHCQVMLLAVLTLELVADAGV